MYNIEQKTYALRSMLWCFWLYLFSFAGFVTTVVVLGAFIGDEHFSQILVLSLALFIVPYVLGAIMFLLIYKNLDIFENMQNTNKVVKLIAFIPVANVAFLYYYFVYRNIVKKEIKELEKTSNVKK